MDNELGKLFSKRNPLYKKEIRRYHSELMTFFKGIGITLIPIILYYIIIWSL
jgi:hypothetical protein